MRISQISGALRRFTEMGYTMTPLKLTSCYIAFCALLTGCAQKPQVIQPTPITLPPVSSELKPVKPDFVERFESRLTEIEKMLGEPMM